MKIEVVLNGERKEIDLKGLKGREVDKFIEEMMKLESAKEDGLKEAYTEFNQKQKDLACRISGLSLNELDDLEVDDRAKIFDYINKKVQNSMGFSKPLQK
jgi:hypothetical protein